MPSGACGDRVATLGCRRRRYPGACPSGYVCSNLPDLKAKYVKRACKITNWPEYEAGLRQRGSLTGDERQAMISLEFAPAAKTGWYGKAGRAVRLHSRNHSLSICRIRHIIPM